MKSFGPAALWAQVEGGPAAYDALTLTAFLLSLVPVTIGNIIGGAGLVGVVYWFIYLRNPAPQISRELESGAVVSRRARGRAERPTK